MSKSSSVDTPSIRKLIGAINKKWGGPHVLVWMELFTDGSGKILCRQRARDWVTAWKPQIQLLAEFDGLGELEEILGQ